MRFFGVLPKLPKMELTMRTPYQTFYLNFSAFTRVYVHTHKGLMSIGNKSYARVYLLPPGELNVKGITVGEGNLCNSESGTFIHTGGWLFVHDNNSCEINLLEAEQKELFAFDKLDQCQNSETESAAGRIGNNLQDKTVKMLQRRR